MLYRWFGFRNGVTTLPPLSLLRIWVHAPSTESALSCVAWECRNDHEVSLSFSFTPCSSPFVAIQSSPAFLHSMDRTPSYNNWFDMQSRYQSSHVHTQVMAVVNEEKNDHRRKGCRSRCLTGILGVGVVGTEYKRNDLVDASDRRCVSVTHISILPKYCDRTIVTGQSTPSPSFLKSSVRNDWNVAHTRLVARCLSRMEHPGPFEKKNGHAFPRIMMRSCIWMALSRYMW